MDSEKERKLDPQLLPAFQAEYTDRLEKALIRFFPPSITDNVHIFCEAGDVGVSIPHGLSEESRGYFLAVVNRTYRDLRKEFTIGSYRVSSEQKDAPITGVALNHSSPATVPQFGERILLLLLLTKEERANIPGDLEEEFKQIAAKHSARFAKLWYYKQVAASAGPMIRKAAGLGLVAWVEEWIRRRV